MEEATFLTKFASHVTVVHRRDTLRASKIMQDKALANPKISFEWNAAVQEVTDTRKGVVTGIVLRDVNTGERKTLAVEGRVRRDRTYAQHPFVQGPDRARCRRLHRAAGRVADERCRGSSRPATCRITSIGRRSPPQGRVAWRRSTPSATSRACRPRPDRRAPAAAAARHFLDPASAENRLAVVEDHRLAGGDRRLGSVELDVRRAVLQDADPRRGGRVPVPDLRCRAQGTRRCASGNPVHRARAQRAALERLARADRHTPRRRVQRGHVQGCRTGDAERPRRWPTVKRWMPACRPSVRPAPSTMRPGRRASGARRATNAA